jgi:hydroxymethylglutaryl-CoA lyase
VTPARPGAATVQLVEVGPRDGLQNERAVIATPDKLRYLELLAGAGLRRIEATSFVHPGQVPQLADAEQLIAGYRRDPGVEISALVANLRGVQRAIDCGVDRVNAIVVVTDEFSRRNQGVSAADSARRFVEMAELARQAGLTVTLTIGAAFGCPFEGEVAPGAVLDLAGYCLQGQPDEICLADTIGVATPAPVHALFTAVGEVTSVPLRAHFHNTRNAGYANAFAAMSAGVTALDVSAGGIGGCPFAPAATGNIATEDLLWALQREHQLADVDLHGVLSAAEFIGSVLGAELPALVGRSPAFP